MAEKRQGENEVEHPRKKNRFAVRQPSLAVADVLRQSGRAAVPQYCKLPTACLRSIEPEVFSGSASSAIREEFGTKTEVSHDEGFILARHRGLLFGRRKNPQVKASLNSRATDGPRLPPWDLGFRAKICLGGCTISDSPTIPIRKSNLPFRAFALPVYYRKRPLMAIALQFSVCLAISMLPRVSR